MAGPTRPCRTILYAGLAGASALTAAVGAAAAQEILRIHDAIVRDALSDARGHEIQRTGDGIMAWFPAAPAALDCAIAVQLATAYHNRDHPDQGFGVKIGVNASDPTAEDDGPDGGDLYGHAVQLAARVTERAYSGEILTTEVVRNLVAGRDYLFAARGQARLKGFDEPEPLFAVYWQGDDA